MSSVLVLYHLARADFLERVRRYAFMVTLAGAVYLGYAVVAGDFRLTFGDYRGVENSAWVGLEMAVVATFFLSFAGFYVVKNTLDRDRQTRVGQILATTSMGKLDYVLGKVLSNLAVLTAIVAVLVAAAAFGQLWAAEDTHLRLEALVSPFLLFTMPTLAFVAALAVLFETIPWLRGGFGNLVYFAFYLSLMVYGLETHNAFCDFLGLEQLESRVQVSLFARLTDYTGGISLGNSGRPVLKTFLWTGFGWQPDLFTARLYWVAVALTLTLLAALLFDRFDPARSLFRSDRLSTSQTPSRLGRWRLRRDKPPLSPVAQENQVAAFKPIIKLPVLGDVAAKSATAEVLAAELRVMLKRQRWWWYAGAVILFMVSLGHSAQEVRKDVLPFVWIWPVLLWSAMGVREARHETSQLVFSAPHPLRRQFPAVWLAGVMVAVLFGAGVALRIILAGDWAGLLAFAVAALFIPTLGLAMGVWTGSSKLFEAVYIVWWYIGPIHHDPGLDFMFTSPRSSSPESVRAYLAATIALFAFALLGRWRQMRR